MNKGFAVQTFNGHAFDPSTGEIDRVDIEDIAHALSNICRYSGHCRDFYSVAEHSVLVSRIIKHLWPDDLEARWAGLLHDATEAYVGDVTTPLKNLLSEYATIENSLALKIATEFDVRQNKLTHSKVRTADLTALATEAPQLFDNVSHWTAIRDYTAMKNLLSKGFPMPPMDAKDYFLKEFKYLKRRLSK